LAENYKYVQGAGITVPSVTTFASVLHWGACEMLCTMTYLSCVTKCDLLTHSLTHTMVQNIIWKADCHSAYQRISWFLHGTRRFITMFTKAGHWTISL